MPKTRSSQRLMDRVSHTEDGASPPPPPLKRQRRSKPSPRGPMTHLPLNSVAVRPPPKTPAAEGQAPRSQATGSVEAGPPTSRPALLAAQGLFGPFPWASFEPRVGLLGPGPSEVPRVSSSVHVNELVAQYSLPSPGLEGSWFSRDPFLGALRGGLAKSQEGALDFSTLATTVSRPPQAAERDSVPELEALRGTLAHSMDREVGAGEGVSPRMAGPLAPSASPEGGLGESGAQPLGPAEAGGAREADGMDATFFEDLAAVAANADIDGREAGWEVLEKGRTGSGGSSAGLVRGLGVEEETRRAVEEWLRDSPDVGQGEAGARVSQEVAAGSEEEQSLPQWVLEELGESEKGQREAPLSRQRLVRADSHGSSTNGPGFELDWQQLGSSEQESVVEVSGLSDAQALASEASEHSARPPSIENSSWHSGGQQPEASTFSSALAHEVLTDDADSAGLCAIPNAVSHMKWSSSTSWIKELLEGDMFWGGLEEAAAPHASASVSQEQDFSSAINGVWFDDGLATS